MREFNKHIIFYVIALFALIEMSVIIYQENNQRDFNRLYFEKKNELISTHHRIDRYLEKFDQNLFTENTILKNIEITDTANNGLALNKIIRGPKLIYRFSEVSCRACVNTDLYILKQLGDSIGEDNILIITEFDNLNKMNAMLNAMDIKSPYYNFKGKLNLSIERDSVTQPPFFFILDNKLRIRFAYKTDDAHDFSSSYFKRIIQFYKTGI